MLRSLYKAYSGHANDGTPNQEIDLPGRAFTRHRNSNLRSTDLSSSPTETLDSDDDIDEPVNIPSKRTASPDHQHDHGKRVRFSDESSTPSQPPIQVDIPLPAVIVNRPRSSADDVSSLIDKNDIRLVTNVTSPINEPNHQPLPSTSVPVPTCTCKSLPALPLEAIRHLQDLSTGLLKTLLDRDAEKDEKLLIAVGSMKKCLEERFMPHMEAWRVAQDGSHDVSETLSVTEEKKQRKASDAALSGSRSDSPTKFRDPDSDVSVWAASIRALSEELSDAQANAGRQQQQIRDQDAQILELKAESLKLRTGLSLAKASKESYCCPVVAPSPTLVGPSQSDHIPLLVHESLQKKNEDQAKKIKNQRSCISTLMAKLSKLKGTVTTNVAERDPEAGGSQTIGEGPEQAAPVHPTSDAVARDPATDASKQDTQPQANGISNTKGNDKSKSNQKIVHSLPGMGKKGQKKARVAARQAKAAAAAALKVEEARQEGGNQIVKETTEYEPRPRPQNPPPLSVRNAVASGSVGAGTTTSDTGPNLLSSSTPNARECDPAVQQETPKLTSSNDKMEPGEVRTKTDTFAGLPPKPPVGIADCSKNVRHEARSSGFRPIPTSSSHREETRTGKGVSSTYRPTASPQYDPRSPWERGLPSHFGEEKQRERRREGLDRDRVDRRDSLSSILTRQRLWNDSRRR